MGAHNIEFKLPKKKFPTEASVMEWYKGAVEQATIEYGRDPYNGSISTTKGIKFFYPAIENDENAAMEFVLKHGVKWGKMAAVELVLNGETFWYIGGWAAS